MADVQALATADRSPASPHHPPDAGRAPAGTGTVVAYVLAFFALYIAVLTPVVSTLALKVDALSTPETRAANLAVVTGVGAFFAFVANPVAGALSDRTTSRLGMRRPWLLWGVLLGAVGLLLIAFAPSIWVVVIGWAVTQAAMNGTQAALQALLPDQVAESQRARVSSLLGMAQQLAPLVGIALAFGFTAAGANEIWIFVVPTLLAVVGVLALVAVLKDRRLDPADVAPFHLGAFLKGFWVSPRRHPDFAWTFLGRFLMLFGFALYNTYQLYFLIDRFGFDDATALSWQLRLMVVQAAVMVVASLIGGVLSDRTGRRKIFVVVATLLAGAGLLTFALVQGPGMLYLGALLFGAGLGAYFAVDLALVTDVLPNAETEAAKNMGVFNIANALPQSVAPALAPVFLAVGAGGNNYTALFAVSAVVVALGAVATLFIRGAR
ncbi:MFS transporter [Krasilnikoviella flava]|uniref:Na+/melibiose symporter n=1 Tax=Krasilnikoviella flava TaxID=526729 RepID=A0A1T5LU55_9MICO|nr:MFS transporter [Krasilnikoviella flava]SKC79098.1 Na+/melibiose symporter [Krasilnikoviella flava]